MKHDFQNADGHIDGTVASGLLKLWKEDDVEEARSLLVTLQDISGQSACLLTRLWKHTDHLRGEVDSFCIPTEEHLEVYGSDDGYLKMREVIGKWLTLGAPRRDAYRIEVWPKSASKRCPKDGWLIQREHSNLIFRLKKSRK